MCLSNRFTNRKLNRYYVVFSQSLTSYESLTLESQTGFEPAYSRFADETLSIRGTATMFGVLYRIRTDVFLRHRQGH